MAIVAGNFEDRGCLVITQLEGVPERAMALLTPGDTTLIDSGLPWTSDCAGGCARLYLRIPRWMVHERAQTSLPVLPRIPTALGRPMGSTSSCLSGIVFSNSLQRFDNPAEALGVNLFGAVIGGLLENAVIIGGTPIVKALALGMYAASAVALFRARSQIAT